MYNAKLVYINPYSGIVGKSVEKICNEYGISFSDIQSKHNARINRPDYIIYGDERISVKGTKQNVLQLVRDATTPKKHLEDIVC